MTDTRHLVITVHGIRTYGNWQDELKKVLVEAEPGVAVRMYRYGFFSSLAFLIPPLRWIVARQFQKFFAEEVRSAPPGARIDLVAHSFGTYLAASALRYLPEGKKINTVIFAASVLPVSFPWYKFLQAGCVGRVVNECGWDDSVLILCQSTALLLGMAGRIGFHGMVGDQFVNRYYRWGHTGYFDEHQRFMRESWVPLLTGDGPVPPHDDRPPLTTWGGIKLFLLSNMQVIKVAGVCLLLMLLVGVPLHMYHLENDRQDVESINHIVRLKNARYMLNSDPAHVNDLLKIDADHVRKPNDFDGLFPNPDTDDGLDVDTRGTAAGRSWWAAFWNSLFGLSHDESEAKQARHAHHQANYFLISHNGGAEKKREKARPQFENALRHYAAVKDKSQVGGSYSLCLIDYGQLLADKRSHDEAITQYKKAREVAFADANGQTVKGPASLTVDSLVREAESYKSKWEWANALRCLEEAIATAEADDEVREPLLCDAHAAKAWYHMERLEVNEAVEEFGTARNGAEKLVNKGKFVYQIRLFWIRHGLALAERLTGNASQAYDDFNQIVSELDKLMRDDLNYTKKERRDLRYRLLNSMERRADVKLFAPDEPPDRAFGTDDPEPSSLARTVPKSDGPWAVAERFQEVIERVREEDPDLKVRVLCKKVIARFLAELEPGQPTGGATPTPDPASARTIDQDFAEAKHIVESMATQRQNELKSYLEVAKACMGLRQARSNQNRSFATPAVEKLRAWVAENSVNCDGMKREDVEMLLLALEILLKPQIGHDADQRAQDARLMMAVIGQTTKAASNPELGPYFDRFQKLAMGRRPSNRPESDGVAHTVLKPPQPENLLFYVWLGPGLELKLTREQVKGRAQTEPPLTRGTPRLGSQSLSRAR
jgi:hypothetical protein